MMDDIWVDEYSHEMQNDIFDSSHWGGYDNGGPATLLGNYSVIQAQTSLAAQRLLLRPKLLSSLSQHIQVHFMRPTRMLHKTQYSFGLWPLYIMNVCDDTYFGGHFLLLSHDA